MFPSQIIQDILLGLFVLIVLGMLAFAFWGSAKITSSITTAVVIIVGTVSLVSLLTISVLLNLGVLKFG